jgi:hypothetical protein
MSINTENGIYAVGRTFKSPIGPCINCSVWDFANVEHYQWSCYGYKEFNDRCKEMFGKTLTLLSWDEGGYEIQTAWRKLTGYEESAR